MIPNISWDRIIRTSVGLRPYRPSGWRVEVERYGEKIVIHNYGHGGAGVSMSWGTAHLAMEEAHRTGHRRFAVAGCGAVGLATARLLQRQGFEVTIYAKDLGSVPSFVEKEKRRNLLLTKQIAQRGEGGIRREEGYRD